MRKKTAGFIIFVAAGLVMLSGLASAFMPLMEEEEREAIRQAIEDGDYEAWKNAIESTLTEENFNKIVEKHDCMPMKNGKMPFKGGRMGPGIPGS